MINTVFPNFTNLTKASNALQFHLALVERNTEVKPESGCKVNGFPFGVNAFTKRRKKTSFKFTVNIR